MTGAAISTRRKHWPLVRLADVSDIQLGKMLSPASKLGTRPRKYLRNANVQWGSFALDDVAEMDFTEAQEEKFSLRDGDVMVCEGGEPGRAAVWRGELPGCLYQKSLHRLRAHPEVLDPEYLALRLRYGALRGEFTGSHAQTTIAHLPAVRLAELLIAVPPLTEQRSMAVSLAGQMDAAARMHAASVANIALLDDAIDGTLRRSLDGADTQEVQLGECLAQVTKGIGADWRAYPLLGVTRSGVAPAKEAAGQYPERYKLVDPGTVFYNPMRILLGSIGMVDAGDPVGITSPDYVVVKGVEGKLHYRWFYWWLRSWRGTEFIKSLTRGAVRERMLFRRLASGSAPLPPWDVQVEAAEAMLKIAAAKHLVAEQGSSIAALPAACLREAFSDRASINEEAPCPRN